MRLYRLRKNPVSLKGTASQAAEKNPVLLKGTADSFSRAASVLFAMGL
jgi:hypothetical protein